MGVAENIEAVGRAASERAVDAAMTVPADLPLPTLARRVAHYAWFVVADLLTLSLALAVAYLAWARPVLGQPAPLYTHLLTIVVFLPLVYLGFGLYPGLGLGAVETLRKLSVATTLSFLLLGALTFALKVPHVYSRMTFAIAWGISLALMPVTRSLFARAATRMGWWGEPVVVVGSNGRLDDVLRELARERSRGYRPVIALDRAGDARVVAGVQVLPERGQAVVLAERGLRAVLLVQDQLALEDLGSELWSCFGQVIVLRGVRELPVEHVGVRNLGGMLGICYANNLLLKRNVALKRALDITIGSVLLVLATPLIALAALAIVIVSPGPVFFSQEREGLGGRRIRVRKLRTMRVDAEERLRALLEHDPVARGEWEQRCKLSRDPRVIPIVGALLRRFSIDELPQLAAVVAGDMALAGPRPFPDYHLQRFSPAFRALRRRVRPGLTGLWQVTVRGEGDAADQEAFDSHYIRNWSVWLDLYLLARTAGAVVTGRGAY